VLETLPIDPLFTLYDIGILRQNPIRVQALGAGTPVLVNTSTTLYRICGNVTESGMSASLLSFYFILFHFLSFSFISFCFISFRFIIAVVSFHHLWLCAYASGSYFAILVNPNFGEVKNSIIIQCAFCMISFSGSFIRIAHS
jgi:hypothetical protein